MAIPPPAARRVVADHLGHACSVATVRELVNRSFGRRGDRELASAWGITSDARRTLRRST
jgi:hypothetical protein